MGENQGRVVPIVPGRSEKELKRHVNIFCGVVVLCGHLMFLL